MQAILCVRLVSLVGRGQARGQEKIRFIISSSTPIQPMAVCMVPEAFGLNVKICS